MKRYGQYCPIARTAEILAERWTPLLLRELLAGNDHFNGIARAVPRMSPSLLSKRLKELQRVGVVARTVDEQGESCYRLTTAGRELEPTIMAMGEWGQRWMHTIRPDELDPTLLMFDIRRTMEKARLAEAEAFPVRPVTVSVRFDDVGANERDWWLVVSRSDIDVCDADPGRPVDVWLSSPIATMYQLWFGETTWQQARRDDLVSVHGKAAPTRHLPRWLGQQMFAHVERSEHSIRG